MTVSFWREGDRHIVWATMTAVLTHCGHSRQIEIMRKHRNLMAIILALLVGCSAESARTTPEFIASWADPTIHTGQSYWYDGETSSYHRIVEKWPGNSIVYHVDKKSVLLIDVDVFDVSSSHEQVNLKSANVKIVPASFGPKTDFRHMTSVSDEVIISSESSLDDNMFKAFEIIRAVCEGGVYSVSCASTSIVPPMNIDRDNLIPVEMMVNHMTAQEPNYVFIRCDSDAKPPPSDLVEECYRLIVEEAKK